MVSTPEGFTNNSPRYPMTPTPVKKTSSRKSLCLLTNILDVKKKTTIRRFRYAKFKHKEIKSGTKPCTLKQNRKLNSKINDPIKKSIHNWIMHHPQFLQSPIFNYCLKLDIDGHTRPQMVPKLLPQISIWELHNGLVSDPVYGGLKEARDAENNIIISDSTLRSLLPPQSNNIITIQGHMWLWTLYIYQKYTFIITIMAWLLF